jgi:Flp pilus assembly protein CpaB
MARTISRSAAERSNRALFIAALVFAGLAAVLFLVFLLRLNGDGGGTTTVAAGELQQVVVANQNIEAGTEITDDMLDVKQVPQSALIPNPLQDEGDLQEGLVARSEIYEGDQISLAKVGDAPEDGSAGSAVDENAVVIGVGVEDVSSIVGGLLQAGDVVDVILVREVEVEGEGTTRQTQACMVAQAVSVFAVADAFNAAVVQGEDSSSTSSDDFEANPEASSVQLEVSTLQAMRVAQAQDDGRVFLALRNNNSKSEDTSLLPCYQ